MIQYLTTSLCNLFQLCPSRLTETPDEVLSLQLRSPPKQVLRTYEAVLTRIAGDKVFSQAYSSRIVHLKEGTHAIRIITDDGRYHFLSKSMDVASDRLYRINECRDHLIELRTLVNELTDNHLYYNLTDIQATFTSLKSRLA